MSAIEPEIRNLFKLCNDANKTLKSVDSYAQHKALREVEYQSEKVFKLLENTVNPMGVKNLSNHLNEKDIILKLYYIILYSLYLFAKNRVVYFDDARSRNSTDLAKKIITSIGESGLSNSPLWLRNDTIYLQGIMQGMRKVHPTLLQNMVRCLTETLRLPSYVNKDCSEYLQPLAQMIKYFTEEAPSSTRVYFDYI